MKHKKIQKCIDCGKAICRAERCRKCYRKFFYKNHKEEETSRNTKWYKKNRIKILAKEKQKRKDEPERFRSYGKKYRTLHPEKKKASSKKRYKEKKEYIKAKSKKWYNENIEKIKIKKKEWRNNNPNYYKEYFQIPHNNIGIKIRTRLNQCLKLYTNNGKIKSSYKYEIDYKKIIKHLKPFPRDRHLYHIDHKIPLCKFNFINKDGTQNLEEIKKAFAPENHQWLLIKDNLSKGGKLTKQKKLLLLSSTERFIKGGVLEYPEQNENKTKNKPNKCFVTTFK